MYYSYSTCLYYSYTTCMYYSYDVVLRIPATPKSRYFLMDILQKSTFQETRSQNPSRSASRLLCDNFWLMSTSVNELKET